ncbi:MAG TPA: PDZ domain-containing protein [Candidatus Scatomorpha intestinavium]|uniref:PDZ domain-containing protein n=1 Tax=Candidatus Scatomorpha intestinavium TaxID=2840922 RepID=A0A9D0ZEZ4_9FIRM|nr:PDZ domain-containing protein [Candidatus Scatomorpha intestinavium]
MKQNSGGPLRAIGRLKINFWIALLLCILCVGVTYGVASSRSRAAFGSEENYAQAMKYLEIKNTIDDYYIGEVDEETISSAAFSAMVNSLGDVWSSYMSPTEYQTYQLYSSNQFIGLGVSIAKDSDTGGFEITGLTEGSPAENAGLQRGDIILSVDGEDVTGMTISDARSLITSHIDESVTLLIDRNGSQTEYTVDCRLIYDNPVSYEMINGNVGYIKISNFESGAADGAIAAIESLLGSGAQYFVFDVRTNPGGLLSELTTLLDYLLPGVDIFVSVDKSGEETVITSNNVCLDMDMCVLVNADSYSAAEFFAAALQEYGWATIVGEHTTGKGRSQQTFELSDGSALHLSTAKYLTPNRVDLSEQGGVAPDIEVALTGNTDSQLDAAVSQLLYG